MNARAVLCPLLLRRCRGGKCFGECPGVVSWGWERVEKIAASKSFGKQAKVSCGWVAIEMMNISWPRTTEGLNVKNYLIMISVSVLKQEFDIFLINRQCSRNIISCTIYLKAVYP
ncbi:hypothetical protein AVEN_110860-1 [Araneus ventricosus]|uniref:Uncharacterized protein n=1 Tax=Araneus ventricosus TaxID=182803 RepID=A0A4Y2XCN2_ARAVE|nr:hypothetical protein AVEN_110860-1 [Araneus ventricosus]